ncbi:MAG: right-handed parallel beta-helix repeat-containing protein [Bacteroidetes bacterium]|nr:right-handed parallel beta-helix repeat-containing protein [Bacteroidota bacterium]
MKKIICLFSIILLFGINSAFASIFYVTNVQDAGSGSLRQAAIDAYSFSGYDSIFFNIPGAGPFVIQLQSGIVVESVYIDGFSQPGNSSSNYLIELDGSLISMLPSGIAIGSSKVTINGVKFINFNQPAIEFWNTTFVAVKNIFFTNNFFTNNDIAIEYSQLTSFNDTLDNLYIANNIFQDNIIGIEINIDGGPHSNITITNNQFIDINQSTNTAIYILPTTTIDTATIQNLSINNNTISNIMGMGIEIDLASNNAQNFISGLAIDNNIIKTISNGSAVLILANGGDIFGFSMSGNNISNVVAYGLEIYLEDSVTNMLIQDNSITNCYGGLYFSSDRSAYIGGVQIIADTISNNLTDAIGIDAINFSGEYFYNTNFLINGNVINDNGGSGINMLGIGVGEINYFNIANNQILNNNGFGIHVINYDTIQMNDIMFTRNSIYNNDSLGIKTEEYNSQYSNPVIPIPTLDSVMQSGNYFIYGNYFALPNTSYRIEYFSNTLPDPSGYGEGEIYLAADTVTTDGLGNVSFVMQTTINIGNLYISSTATDLNTYNTSQFSNIMGTDISTVPFLESNYVDIYISPNPSSDFILINYKAKTSHAQFEIIDVIGRKILSTKQTQIDISKLPQGLYLLKVRDGDLIFSKRFLKD